MRSTRRYEVSATVLYTDDNDGDLRVRGLTKDQAVALYKTLVAHSNAREVSWGPEDAGWEVTNNLPKGQNDNA